MEERAAEGGHVDPPEAPAGAALVVVLRDDVAPVCVKPCDRALGEHLGGERFARARRRIPGPDLVPGHDGEGAIAQRDAGALDLGAEPTADARVRIERHPFANGAGAAVVEGHRGLDARVVEQEALAGDERVVTAVRLRELRGGAVVEVEREHGGWPSVFFALHPEDDELTDHGELPGRAAADANRGGRRSARVDRRGFVGAAEEVESKEEGEAAHGDRAEQ